MAAGAACFSARHSTFPNTLAYRSNDTSVVAANEEVNGRDGAAFSFSLSFTTPHMSVGGSLLAARCGGEGAGFGWIAD